jgi:hypothetical protein
VTPLDSVSERLVLAAQGVSPTVRLVGGAGLAMLLGHRMSDDLDLFGGVREDIDPIVRAIDAEAMVLGLAPNRVRSGPGFVRIELPREDSVLRIDVASDASSRIDTRDTLVGRVRVESLRDQRANKIAALLGRSELRDLVDLFFIDQAGLPAAMGFDDATSKDKGMDPAWFAWALDQIKVAPLRGMVAKLDLEGLERFRINLKQAALERAGAI